MKPIFLILVLVIMVGTLSAVQPARKPFIKMKIDGTLLKTGDVSNCYPRPKIKFRG